MAKEFFKNLPSQETPFNASRWNGLLNGEEAMGSIVVDDITCKNILPNFAVSRTINGVTFTINKDKSITIKGTATADTDLYLINAWGSTSSFTTLDGDYTLSTGINNPNITLFLTYEKTVIASTTSKVTKTFSETDIACAFIRVGTGATVDTTIYPQLEKGTVMTDYAEHKNFDSTNANKFVETFNNNNKTIYTSGVNGFNIDIKFLSSVDKCPITVFGTDSSNGTVVLIISASNSTSSTSVSIANLAGSKTVTRKGLRFHINAAQYSYYTINCPEQMTITVSEGTLES